MKSEINKVMKKIGFEEIGTGGGCVGWYGKKGDLTFYITVMSDLTLPQNGDHASMGVYDGDFEEQFMSMDIKRFDPLHVEKYIEKCVKKFNSKAFQLRLKNNNSEITYF